MTLTAGHGPLSADPAGWFTPALPDGTVYAEPHPGASWRWRRAAR